MLSLILAAALQSAGDIKTGADLLHACRQSDTAACDSFIKKVTMTPVGGCVDLSNKNWLPETRVAVIDLLQSSPSLLTEPAGNALDYVFSCDAD